MHARLDSTLSVCISPVPDVFDVSKMGVCTLKKNLQLCTGTYVPYWRRHINTHDFSLPGTYKYRYQVRGTVDLLYQYRYHGTSTWYKVPYRTLRSCVACFYFILAFPIRPILTKRRTICTSLTQISRTDNKRLFCLICILRGWIITGRTFQKACTG
jgi:hypothetical protein